MSCEIGVADLDQAVAAEARLVAAVHDGHRELPQPPHRLEVRRRCRSRRARRAAARRRRASPENRMPVDSSHSPMLPGEWPGRCSTSKWRSPRSMASPRRAAAWPVPGRSIVAATSPRRRGVDEQLGDVVAAVAVRAEDGVAEDRRLQRHRPGRGASSASAVGRPSANSPIPPTWSLWAWVATATAAARAPARRGGAAGPGRARCPRRGRSRPSTCQTLQRRRGCTWGSVTSVIPSPTRSTTNHGSATGRSSKPPPYWRHSLLADAGERVHRGRGRADRTGTGRAGPRFVGVLQDG